MGIFSSKSKMKTLGEQEGFIIMDLGDRLYLLNPKEPTNRVVISAHGGHTLTTTNIFTVPADVVLRFYSDDTYSVLDPGFSNFYKKEAVPKEILSEGDQCFDYVLSKYQGKGNNTMGETYESIARTINNEYKYKKQSAADLQDAVTKGKPEKVQNILRTGLSKAKVPAVLTVRNRHFRADMRLSVAIAEVKAAAPGVVIFDCLFCRSTMFGGSQPVALIDR